MPGEDGPAPPDAEVSDEAAPTESTAPSLALLEQLTALANQALEAMREGDMTAVNELLADRERFLARLATALTHGTLPAGSLSDLAQRDVDVLQLLERGIAEARIQVAGELDTVTAAQATVSRYAEDAPLAPPPATIDIRR